MVEGGYYTPEEGAQTDEDDEDVMSKDVSDLSEEQRKKRLEKQKRKLEQKLEKDKIRAEYEKKKKEMKEHVEAGGYTGKAASAFKSGLETLGELAGEGAKKVFDEKEDYPAKKRPSKTRKPKPVGLATQPPERMARKKPRQGLVISGLGYKPPKKKKKSKDRGMKPATFELKPPKPKKGKKSAGNEFKFPEMDFSDIFGKKEKK